MKKSLFIVEDDLLSAQYLKEILEKEGFEILGTASSGEEALQKLRSCAVDLVLMDVMLKGAMSGSEAAVRLRSMHPSCRIIFLTAYADEEMIDSAVDAKAFAYLMKPYREAEIVATIRMALSQPIEKEGSDDAVILKEGYVFYKKERKLEYDGRMVPLSEKKLRLLEILVENRGSVVPNEQLSLYIWGEPKSNSTLRSLINRFRNLVDDELVTNVNGIGYAIVT